MGVAPRVVGHASGPTAGEGVRRHLRVIVACEVVFVLVLLGLSLALPQVRVSPNLLVFFLYGIPCEFLVPVVPHEPAILYVARFHGPMIVALVAGGGTLVSETINYDLLQRLGTTAALTRLFRARMMQRVTDLFTRAPFLALWIAGFVPVIPFMPLRLLVILRRYPRGRYVAAAVSSRTARFYVVAVAGTVIRLPGTAIAIFFLVLVFAVTIPGAYHVLARAKLFDA